jgi:hypothetical protein
MVKAAQDDEAMSGPKGLTTGLSERDAARAKSAAIRPPLRPDMTVRQIALDYPDCREVLDRHGEPVDRPTKFGHLEPLDHFARRRGIDLECPLFELARAARVAVDRDSAWAQLVHRPFIAWALAFTLSQGAGLGALLHFEIGWHGRVGHIRDVSGRKYRVRVRRTTGTTHQFLMLVAKDLKRVACPKGWMSPEGYVRYLTATLATTHQRQARLGKPG